MARTVCAVLMLGLFWPGDVCAQGLLERAREETHEGSGDSSSGSDGTGTRSHDSGSNDGSEDGLGALLFLGLVMPFAVPRDVLGDTGDSVAYFPSWPYARADGGYPVLHASQHSVTQPGEMDDIKGWAFRASIDEGNDFHRLNRIGLSVKLDTASRWGLTSNWQLYDETLPCGCHDETLIGDTNVTYRFAQSEKVQMYAGLGFRLLTDPRDTRAGVNFVYGGDWFLVQPMVLSASFDLGNLDAAFVCHGRATLGATWQRWEVFGGYDFLRIGSVNLQGPLLGLRIWF